MTWWSYSQSAPLASYWRFSDVFISKCRWLFMLIFILIFKIYEKLWAHLNDFLFHSTSSHSNVHACKFILLLLNINSALLKLTGFPSCSPWWRVCWNGSASYPSYCSLARPAVPTRGRLERRASDCPPSASDSIVAPPYKTSSAAYQNPQHESSLFSEAKIRRLKRKEKKRLKNVLIPMATLKMFLLTLDPVGSQM